MPSLKCRFLRLRSGRHAFMCTFLTAIFTFLGGHSFGPHLQKPFQHLMLWIIALLHEMLLLQRTTLPHLLLCVSPKQTPLAPVQLTTWPSSTKCWRLLFNVLIVRTASTGWFYSPSQFKEKVTGLLLNYFIDSHNSNIYAIDRYNSIIPVQQSLLLLSIEP